ncbi:MAG: hypothetical protein WBL21_00030 [Salinimicrobium sp.]
MKKLFFFAALLLTTFTITAQSKYAKAFAEAAAKTDSMPEVIAFKQQLKADLDELRESQSAILQNTSDLKEITVFASVLEINQKTAIVVSRRFGKHYEVNTTALQKGYEYRFRILVSPEDQKLIHCSGCTGILPAKIVGYSISEAQAKRNAVRVDRIGYDRNPRYGF